MRLDLSYDEICTKFDRLISNGIINYQPNEPILVVDGGMTFSFHLVESLKTKPQAEDAPETKSSLTDGANTQPMSFGPGSDIANDHPDICITTVNETHYLVINKFPVFRPMLLLLTVDSYRRQHERLVLEDLEAAWAGSSREHKHLQVIPAPGKREGYDEAFKLFPDDDTTPKTGPSFVHFLQRFEDLPEGCVRNGEHLLEIYQRLLQQARDALVLPTAVVPCPHNFVLTRRWMMVIPRRAKEFHGIMANAPGMMGSIYIWNHGQLDAWKEIGPMKALAELGLPRENCC
ncbi:hypothetical protein PENSOL_c001G02612 [Penicillium solitum]|uniref:Uncharacterized protein n=1 Tax=Penicillium solitum TaxID=60172 RepID=A0A1V6RP99_9EURO|nr:uncharacterized protein PENSOL_c001G02612 [Penicillium solitum]OQE03263.1 hypothetical protein PENSOL_c001G02612 [Penicillium solitum]